MTREELAVKARQYLDSRRCCSDYVPLGPPAGHDGKALCGHCNYSETAHALWELCTALLSREADIAAQAATIAQLQQHISRIETETKSWIDDLIAEGGARKTGPLRHILAVIQSRANGDITE